MPLTRLEANPLLTPDDVPATQEGLEVLCTLNPAAVRIGSETILLVRVGERAIPEPGWVSCAWFNAETGRVEMDRIREEDADLQICDSRTFRYQGVMRLTSLSHLRVARSRDGVQFRFDERPAVFPCSPYEAYGCEDARITPLEGRYYVTYTAVSDCGVTVAMASTEDFVQFERHGVIFPPYQKNVAIFPQKVSGRYVCRHRPFRSEFNPASIWTAWSPDLLSWGAHEMTLAPVAGSWRSDRVGCGAPPVRTDEGWLEIIHGADDGGRYFLGAMLSDLDHPQRVVACSRHPVLRPEAPYEKAGVYAECVFSNGLVADEDGRLVVYYGAADRICAGALTTVAEMVAAARD